MKILHIMINDGDLKFLRPFVMFVNEHFAEEDHKFIIIGEGIAEKHINSKNVLFIKRRIIDLLKIFREINSADKIILHSLNSGSVVFLLLLQPWLLKRSYWVMWGYDLYSKDIQGRSFRLWLYGKAKRYVAKNVGFLVSQIEGDYKLAQKFYGAKGSYKYSFVYPSNLFKKLEGVSSKTNKDNLIVQIGNSAYESNNHLEVLNQLKKYRDKNIKVICPLSYGSKDYRNRVIEAGREIFGDKFIPILDFLPINEYVELLNSVDVAIFAHKEQQALGNITTLLGLGKKVYILKDTTTWKFCIDHDLKVFIANGDFEDLFEPMEKEMEQNNRKNVKAKFSEEKLVEDLKKIFDEEIN